MKSIFPFLSACCQRLTRFVSSCFRECPVRQRCGILILSAFLNLLFVSALIAGCSHSEQGIAREQAVYTVATNALGQVQTLVPFVPQPFATPIELILGVISALLAAWNLHQQNALKVLRNGGPPPLAGPVPPSSLQPPAASLPQAPLLNPPATPRSGP